MLTLFENEYKVQLEQELTKSQYKILETLIKNWKKPTTFEELFDAVWEGKLEDNYFSNLRCHISKLRRKGINIKTVPKIGYILDEKMIMIC